MYRTIIISPRGRQVSDPMPQAEAFEYLSKHRPPDYWLASVEPIDPEEGLPCLDCSDELREGEKGRCEYCMGLSEWEAIDADIERN